MSELSFLCNEQSSFLAKKNAVFYQLLGISKAVSLIFFCSVKKYEMRRILLIGISTILFMVSQAQDIDGISGATRTQQKNDTINTDLSDPEFGKFRLGGYGEMLMSFKNYGINRFYGGSNGNSRTHRTTIAIPRFVLALDYKFNDNWLLGAEIEFEAGGTGTAVELENTENGEYETEVEKGGEVALEQFHLTRKIIPQFNVRAGHIIVPVGLTNYCHEPINFFGTSRPEGETTIIPSTWHETGLEFFGQVEAGLASFDYEAMLVTGLNANGFDRNTWVAKGKQGFFEEDNFYSPAYVARLNWRGIQGLRIGGSVYYCEDTGDNSDKEASYKSIDDASLFIWTADAQYKCQYLTARANIINGNLEASEELTGINTKLSNKSPYSRTGPVAKKAIAYGGELGVNIAGIFNNAKMPAIMPFARYEYYNPQEEGAGMQTMDKRCQVSMWTFGMNYYVLPNLVVKADYTTRHIGTDKMFGSGKYNDENEFSIGLAYVGWFVTK